MRIAALVLTMTLLQTSSSFAVIMSISEGGITPTFVETFEGLDPVPLGISTSIFSGNATLEQFTGGRVETPVVSLGQAGNVVPIDGGLPGSNSQFYFDPSFENFGTVVFNSPVTSVGGYFGAQTAAIDGPSIISLQFFASTADIIANNPISDPSSLGILQFNDFDGGMAELDWHGFGSSTPFVALTIDSFTPFVVDGLQASAVPEPSAVTFLCGTALCGLCLRRRRKEVV